MKIAVTQFVTLDGVSQGPGSADEDPTNGFTHGGRSSAPVDLNFTAWPGFQRSDGGDSLWRREARWRYSVLSSLVRPPWSFPETWKAKE